jgi:hypothetical protein
LHKIAIVFGEENYRDYHDSDFVIDRITEFVEVDDKTFEILNRHSSTEGYRVVETPISTPDFIKGILEKHKIYEAEEAKQRKLEEARRSKQRAAQEEKKRLQSEKNRIASEKNEKKLLEDLLKKHGVPKSGIL